MKVAIINVYASLIKKGVKTLDDVPLKIYEAVKTALDVGDDNIIVSDTLEED